MLNWIVWNRTVFTFKLCTYAKLRLFEIELIICIMRLAKAWTAIDRLSVIWKSDLTDNMKRSFFQAKVVLILLYGCTTWMLTKRMEKKLDGNDTRMLQAILNKSWRQHPTKQQLYSHLPPITKTIQVRRTKHVGHCWRSNDELISVVLLWTSSHGREKAGRPARIYVVHTISFQTFFLWAFKIVIDSWQFSMLLLYILWDDWPIFMISASNEQLQQQLEYTLLNPDYHSWWISKMQSDTLEERYAIKFCFKLGKNAATETYGMLQTAFGASCMNRASVF